nr:MAG TPA: hypothetical protein [Caudoviricetes sp.]
MKKYVGTKIIEAKEMNLGDYNNYRGWKIPENENPKKEGYLVKYPDGYESWSLKEIFEDAYRKYDESKLPATSVLMQSNDYKERFKAEYKQLDIRYKGLEAMLKKWDAGELNFTPTCPRNIYNIQIRAMEEYLTVLETRAIMEKIDLD